LCHVDQTQGIVFWYKIESFASEILFSDYCTDDEDVYFEL